jgi:hypothetical protein
MKRFFFSSLVMVALLALTTSTVFAGTALSLLKVRNDDGVPTFVFRVNGTFTNGELHNQGYVLVSGEGQYALHCAVQDETTVVCHTSKKAAGHRVMVHFGGSDFWTVVPEERPVAPKPAPVPAPIFNMA